MTCYGYMADGTVDVAGDRVDDCDFVCVLHRINVQYYFARGALHMIRKNEDKTRRIRRRDRGFIYTRVTSS